MSYIAYSYLHRKYCYYLQQKKSKTNFRREQYSKSDTPKNTNTELYQTVYYSHRESVQNEQTRNHDQRQRNLSF